MAEFRKEKVDMFLGVVRKYMQMRGAISQKELALMTDTGISTMSRFLNQKTTELNANLIAKIVAKLNIPLHEMIDFVEEDFADRFIRLVKFFKKELSSEFDDTVAEPLKNEEVTEEIKVETAEEKKDVSIREKLERLSPRQKAFLNDFLELDMDGRDLMVDLGNVLFRYVRQKGSGH